MCYFNKVKGPIVFQFLHAHDIPFLKHPSTAIIVTYTHCCCLEFLGHVELVSSNAFNRNNFSVYLDPFFMKYLARLPVELRSIQLFSRDGCLMRLSGQLLFPSLDVVGFTVVATTVNLQCKFEPYI